jgi:lysophospholipid acyltransferase (LPLAT)-like uncharacterized protein
MRIGRALRKQIVSRLGPWLAYWMIRMLESTMRFEHINGEIPMSLLQKEIQGIGAFWHGRLLMMGHAYKGQPRKGLSFLVSSHRDGKAVGKALERFGYHPILGSTTRGGFFAFSKMVKAFEEGHDLVVVPDGPRGPRCQVQPGVIELAKLTGAPIVPLAFSASKRKILNTWDQFLLPYPFSKGVFVWGEPVLVDPDGNMAHLEEKRAALERRLNDLTEFADRYFGTGIHSNLRQGG